jgi:nitronate monooxygenase
LGGAEAETRIVRQRSSHMRPPFAKKFEHQFAVVLEERAAVFSFTFGLLDQKVLEECRKRDILTFGTATTPEEGLVLQEIGVDATTYGAP